MIIAAIAGRSVLVLGAGVLGAGVLGATACAMARSAGALTVVACDPVPAWRERALAFGATHALPADLAAGLPEITRGRGVDVALELAGTAESVQLGLAALRIGGTMLLAGTVLPVGTIGLDPEQVVRRMLTIRGVHNYHPRDLMAALKFLASAGQTFPFEELIAAVFPLVDAEQAFARAHAEPGRRVMVVPETEK